MTETQVREVLINSSYLQESFHVILSGSTFKLQAKKRSLTQDWTFTTYDPDVPNSVSFGIDNGTPAISFKVIPLGNNKFSFEYGDGQLSAEGYGGVHYANGTVKFTATCGADLSTSPNWSVPQSALVNMPLKSVAFHCKSAAGLDLTKHPESITMQSDGSVTMSWQERPGRPGPMRTFTVVLRPQYWSGNVWGVPPSTVSIMEFDEPFDVYTPVVQAYQKKRRVGVHDDDNQFGYPFDVYAPMLDDDSIRVTYVGERVKVSQANLPAYIATDDYDQSMIVDGSWSTLVSSSGYFILRDVLIQERNRREAGVYNTELAHGLDTTQLKYEDTTLDKLSDDQLEQLYLEVEAVCALDTAAPAAVEGIDSVVARIREYFSNLTDAAMDGSLTATHEEACATIVAVDALAASRDLAIDLALSSVDIPMISTDVGMTLLSKHASLILQCVKAHGTPLYDDVTGAAPNGLLLWLNAMGNMVSKAEGETQYVGAGLRVLATPLCSFVTDFDVKDAWETYRPFWGVKVIPFGSRAVMTVSAVSGTVFKTDLYLRTSGSGSDDDLVSDCKAFMHDVAALYTFCTGRQATWEWSPAQTGAELAGTIANAATWSVTAGSVGAFAGVPGMVAGGIIGAIAGSALYQADKVSVYNAKYDVLNSLPSAADSWHDQDMFPWTVVGYYLTLYGVKASKYIYYPVKPVFGVIPTIGAASSMRASIFAMVALNIVAIGAGTSMYMRDTNITMRKFTRASVLAKRNKPVAAEQRETDVANAQDGQYFRRVDAVIAKISQEKGVQPLPKDATPQQIEEWIGKLGSVRARQFLPANLLSAEGAALAGFVSTVCAGGRSVKDYLSEVDQRAYNLPQEIHDARDRLLDAISDVKDQLNKDSRTYYM